MDILKQLSIELKLRESIVKNTVELLDSGNTIPFIARYRKEMTGEMDETVIRKLEERLTYLRNLETRKQEVHRLIKEQEKMTEEIEVSLKQAETLQEVEDIYRPFKPKRRTRATIAKEKGLEPLAIRLLESGPESPKELAEGYLGEGVETIEDALQGARDIIAEMVSDNSEFRKWIRTYTINEGKLISKGVEEEETVYKMYYDYSEAINKLPSHRILAINRGENEKKLQIKLELDELRIHTYLKNRFIQTSNNQRVKEIEVAIEDSYKRLIAPSIEREIRSQLTEAAEEKAIAVFGDNLGNLLLTAPIRDCNIMGIDPAFRTGCKLACIDKTGKLLETDTIYPVPPQNKLTEGKERIKSLIKKYDIKLISIGNGTASRETESVVAETLEELKLEVFYTIVNEAGASVYSASPLAKKEFPDLDVSLRGAVSIARRLQDPMAELVKIDPKSVGVGQYQHDVSQKRLEETLKFKVESCVNLVGVDVNTASPALLQYISGINSKVAENIVEYRDCNGPFNSREELKKVPRLGANSFVQCAGFLRIAQGRYPLDNTPIHPESYHAAEGLLSDLGFKIKELTKDKLMEIRESLSKIDIEKKAKELEIGIPTLRDIVTALQKPGRDPREDMPKPIFHSKVKDIDDLTVGMVLQGTIRNVVDFGAFVDIGIKQDGLVHISQLSDKFIKHPSEVAAVGQNVKVEIIGIDKKMGRISLSMKNLAKD
jgi:uncharacterized protein